MGLTKKWEMSERNAIFKDEKPQKNYLWNEKKAEKYATSSSKG